MKIKVVVPNEHPDAPDLVAMYMEWFEIGKKLAKRNYERKETKND